MQCVRISGTVLERTHLPNVVCVVDKQGSVELSAVSHKHIVYLRQELTDDFLEKNRPMGASKREYAEHLANVQVLDRVLNNTFSQFFDARKWP